MTSREADRKAWEDAHAECISASDVARLLCESWASSEQRKREQRAQLIMEKAGLAEREHGDEQAEETMAIAAELEPSVISRARKQFGWDLRAHGVLTWDKVCPRLAATPDSVMDTPWGMCTVNVKVSACAPPEDCKPKKDGSPSGAAFANGVPIYYQLQLQAEMAVMGFQYSSLLVLHYSERRGLRLRAYYVPRHERAISRIRFEVTRAWREVEALRAGRIAV